MPISISRLRRWFAVAAVFVCLAVAGAYFYARHRVQNALKQVPSKMGIEIQQSAQGFTISKSEQGRTIFKLQASKAVQFKQGGRAELHDVMITLYGRDSSRFDQVYGKEFEYDQQSGNVTSKGEVSIDLEANPKGMLDPDQAAPKELKNPIHLRTKDLIFNQKTGDAWTAAAVEFRVPQASGSAMGARYVAKESALTLQSQLRIVFNGPMPSTILAEQAVLEKSPRQIVLRHAHAESPEQQAQADELTLFLRPDNTLDRAVATGDVRIKSIGNRVAADTRIRGKARRPEATKSEMSAQKLEVHMQPKTGVHDAVLSGDVRFKIQGPQSAETSAGRALLSFGKRNTIIKVHAEDQVKLAQHATLGPNAMPEVEMTAPAMDFFVADGQRLTRAETIGPPQISFVPSGSKQAGATRITADKFTANFDDHGQLASVHGEPSARVVTSGSPQEHAAEPDRVSSSDSIEAFFHAGRGIEAVIQQGHFTYSSGAQRAFADRARYSPADQILVLNGSPRILDSGMATTARTVRLNRATGDGLAEADVKSTYSDLKQQPGGGLLASSDPVHVTAQSMTAHSNPAIATYKGNARLWQNANVVEAPSIQFQKEQRMLIADSGTDQKVSTVLVGTDNRGKATPVSITSRHLTYRDSERKIHFDGGVTVRGSDLSVTSNQMDVFLAPSPQRTVERRASSPVLASPAGETPVAPQSQAADEQSQSVGPAKLEKIIASGSVLITEPNRHATGEQLTYTASDDKFVLTGGPPSILDAEHGKITGVSLTLFRRDDRVVVEGDSSSPAVTQTRVVR